MKKSFLKIFVLFFLVIFFSKYNISNASFIGTSPTVVATSTCSVGLSCGLVGYWTFDGKDMVRGVARDMSGSGNHANLINISTSTFYALGKIGQGFNFDFSNDAANLSTNILSGRSSFSIMMWARKNKTATGALFASRSGGPYWRVTSVGGDTLLWVEKSDCSTGLNVSYPLLTDDKFHLVGITMDSSGNVVTYKDGVSVGSNNFAGWDSVCTDANDWGSIGNYAASFPFGGVIDDARIYNRALSASEISQLYSSGASTKQGASPTVTATTCSAGLSCGLVGYWTFDGNDMTNGVALDKSGNNNRGNLISISTSTFYSSGQIGQGFNFDGSDDAVRAADSSSLDISDAQSVTQSAWVYSTSFASHPQVIEKRGNYELRVNTTGNVDSTKYYSNTTRCRRTTTNPITLNKWHHIVSVAVNTNCPDIYVNGVLQSSSGTPEVGNYEVIQPLGIGNRSVVNTQQWVGKLDDVRIYNRALSASEISQLYSSGASTKQNSSQTVTSTSTCSFGLSCGLVGYWTFDGKDVVSGVVLDKSGNNNRGNLINISTSTFYVPGKIGQGFNFDGNNDRINFGDNNIFDGNAAMTWSFWFNDNSYLVNTSPISKGSQGAGTASVWSTYESTTGITLRLINSTPTTAGNAIIPYDFKGKWAHLVWTYDGSFIRGYKDGVEVMTPVAFTGVLNSTSDALMFGADASTFNNISAGIDDVRIYNRALSASEINQLYNMGK